MDREQLDQLKDGQFVVVIGRLRSPGETTPAPQYWVESFKVVGDGDGTAAAPASPTSPSHPAPAAGSAATVTVLTDNDAKRRRAGGLRLNFPGIFFGDGVQLRHLPASIEVSSNHARGRASRDCRHVCGSCGRPDGPTPGRIP